MANFKAKPFIVLVALVVLVVVVSYTQFYNKSPTVMNVVMYTMPEESESHEGTWLQWPHHYQYGIKYRDGLDDTWVSMVAALVTSEKVHIIAYDNAEENRIRNLLQNQNIPLDSVDFKIYKTDDVWVRDNGPIYVRDKSGNLVIQDWGFNGWGTKIDVLSGRPIEYSNDNIIPSKIAKDQGRMLVELDSTIINEGGSIEIDGSGTMMATKSSILNNNRNPGLTQEQAETIFEQYLGISNFIWLDGQAGLDLTDQHIDGFARFANKASILTMEHDDLLNFGVKQVDIDRLYAAKNKDGKSYVLVKVPLTQKNVVTVDGDDLGYKGSYVNYYIANNVVLVPNYDDPNDMIANEIIQSLYPTRKVIGIDVRNLYQNGGMVHCVTQQQPL